MTLNELLPIVSLCFVIAGFFAGRMSAGKDQGKQEGMILGELGYVKSSIDDVKHKLDTQDEHYADMRANISAIDQAVKSAHNRIDGIERRCCGGE